MADKIKLVLPWADEEFEGTMAEKEMVYRNLRRMRFPVDKWKTLPEEFVPEFLKVEESMEMILPMVLSHRKWQMVCSNSIALLQSLAELCPIVFSLTTHDSSVMVTTEKIVARLKVRDFEDVKQLDDIVWQATFAGFMTWLNVTQPHESGDRYHSKFADILVRRKYALNYPAVFLASYVPVLGKGFDEKSVESIFGKVRHTLGDTAASAVQENVSVRYLEVEVKPSEVVSVKL